VEEAGVAKYLNDEVLYKIGLFITTLDKLETLKCKM